MVKQINISIRKIFSDLPRVNSDTVGVFASGLCMAHCIATPFFFIASACSLSCCSAAPAWWQWLDYAFLLISLSAIFQVSKSSNTEWVKYGLWISWLALSMLIMNITFGWINLADNIKFIPAFTIVVLHVYNMRYCKCEKECC